MKTNISIIFCICDINYYETLPHIYPPHPSLKKPRVFSDCIQQDYVRHYYSHYVPATRAGFWSTGVDVLFSQQGVARAHAAALVSSEQSCRELQQH